MAEFKIRAGISAQDAEDWLNQLAPGHWEPVAVSTEAIQADRAVTLTIIVRRDLSGR